LQFKDIIKRAITDFERHNKTIVNKIIFLRDGITDFQRRFVETTEITFINEVFADLQKEDMNLFFITANKRISTKIFEFSSKDNSLKHLEAGI